MHAQNAIVSDIPENSSDTQVGERDTTHITSVCIGMSGSSLAKPYINNPKNFLSIMLQLTAVP
jgi:hypothetical protein